MKPCLYVVCLVALILTSGCAQLTRLTQEQLEGFTRMIFAPVNTIINEAGDIGNSPDFKMSQGDMKLVFPEEDLREYTYEMKVTGINNLGQTVKFHAVAEIQDPRTVSKLPVEAATPMVIESECPEIQPCPDASCPPCAEEEEPTAAQQCLENPDLIALSIWLQASARTGFSTCQEIIDENSGTPYLVDVIYYGERCVITLEDADLQGPALRQVQDKHDTIREQQYTLIPLYPHDFLNTISGSKQSLLPVIDACLFQEDPAR